MNNYREKLIDALRINFEAQIVKHKMNVEVLLGSHVGVAEHSDIMETIEKELAQVAHYQDLLDNLERHYA